VVDPTCIVTGTDGVFSQSGPACIEAVDVSDTNSMVTRTGPKGSPAKVPDAIAEMVYVIGAACAALAQESNTAKPRMMVAGFIGLLLPLHFSALSPVSRS
jgi:hypothetical protein